LTPTISPNSTDDYRARGVRIGPMDLKIGCIAITFRALLLTANTTDFSQVPHLDFQNWLAEAPS
jgi:predicted nucleic acid-binding protein